MSFAQDSSRDLVVGLQSIISNSPAGSTVSLLPIAILTFVDSTTPFLYLPVEACIEFEKSFGLIWNSTFEMYFLNDSLHETLLAKNPQFVFQIGNSKTSGPTIDITLPYASFDLVVTYPIVDNSTRFFPLRRAANDSQYTLGRTFLQEAYVR